MSAGGSCCFGRGLAGQEKGILAPEGGSRVVRREQEGEESSGQGQAISGQGLGCLLRQNCHGPKNKKV